jgi:hypothetical protein
VPFTDLPLIGWITFSFIAASCADSMLAMLVAFAPMSQLASAVFPALNWALSGSDSWRWRSIEVGAVGVAQVERGQAQRSALVSAA